MSAPFGKYREFVTHLRELSRDATEQKHNAWLNVCASAVNGDAERYLERLISLDARRKAGAFFTPSVLAKRLATRAGPVDRKRQIVDPAMGAGNLLLAAARQLGRARSVTETVEHWTEGFAGLDDKSVFVESTRLRLWLLAHLLHSSRPKRLPEEIDFSAVRQSNLLETPDVFAAASDVLLNPPFSRIAAPIWYPCGRGRVNSAAVMSLFVARHMATRTRLHAILPEVLRSGTNYAEWRASISRQCDVRNVVSCGLFGTADVDVFIATFEKRRVVAIRSVSGWPSRRRGGSVVADEFAVSVGPVVDFRDPEKGPFRAYIRPRNVPAWKVIRRIAGRRRYSGRLVTPPFVVLRRTSRPGDAWRAAGSIVLGSRPVAVENHFIVCQPNSRTVASCRQLLRQLKSATVNRFLNSEIRCRHLTTGIVAQIPLLD